MLLVPRASLPAACWVELCWMWQVYGGDRCISVCLVHAEWCRPVVPSVVWLLCGWSEDQLDRSGSSVDRSSNDERDVLWAATSNACGSASLSATAATSSFNPSPVRRGDGVRRHTPTTAATSIRARIRPHPQPTKDWSDGRSTRNLQRSHRTTRPTTQHSLHAKDEATSCNWKGPLRAGEVNIVHWTRRLFRLRWGRWLAAYFGDQNIWQSKVICLSVTVSLFVTVSRLFLFQLFKHFKLFNPKTPFNMYGVFCEASSPI